MSRAIRIIGIDPGLRRTGWGVIDISGSAISFVAAGTVTSEADELLAERLLSLHVGLMAIMREFVPHEAAVEQTFVNRDAGATLKLGQARGIAMLVPAQAGLAVAEYAPNAVKKTVVGAGHADKGQIRMMVRVLLPRADLRQRRRRRRARHRHHPCASSRLGRCTPLGRGYRMIGKLKGIVDSYGEDYVILDVGGVGYQVQCSTRTLRSLPATGEAASLSIETYVREDMIRLYGFGGDVEREWFRLLMTVQGVGARVAMAVLGVLSPADLATAIALSDYGQISRAPGVGKKVAERIVAELRDKAPAYSSADPAVIHLQSDLADKRAPRPVSDAVSALTNLGYGQPQASAAIAAAVRAAGEGATTEALIRLGLKELAR